MIIGKVFTLWRYPVKSMAGEELVAAVVGPRGILGDRIYAILDVTSNKIATAKKPKDWAKLLGFRAALAQEPRHEDDIPKAMITLPNGSTIRSDHEHIHHVLSEILGRPVRLLHLPAMPMRMKTAAGFFMPANTFFDDGTIHLISTATLACFKSRYPQGDFDIRRFRPNLVIALRKKTSNLGEEAWLGRTIAIGKEATLEITKPTRRCVMTTLTQGQLPHDPMILRTIGRHNDTNAGAYACVLKTGTIHVGDAVQII